MSPRLGLLLLPWLAACATHSPQPQTEPPRDGGAQAREQSPALGVIKTMDRHDYRYLIYGDPVVAPAQAFSDAHYLYLQLKPDQHPPLAYTRGGDLIEYDVIRSIMRLPKIDSVVLRIGTRRAYVDHKEARIIRPEPAAAQPPVEMDIAVRLPSATLQWPVEAKPEALVDQLAGFRRVTVCHAPVVGETRAAKALARAIEARGVRVELKMGCKEDGLLDIEGEMK